MFEMFLESGMVYAQNIYETKIFSEGGHTMKTTLYEIMDALVSVSEDDSAIIDFVNYLFDTGYVHLTN